MKYNKRNTGDCIHAAAWLMLVPLFVFLLFSCPVKRALLSKSLPVGTITYSDVIQVQSASTLSGGNQSHCCQDVTVSITSYVFQPFNKSVTPDLVALLPASIPFQHNVFQRAASTSIHPHQTSFHNTRLFLENQSLII